MFYGNDGELAISCEAGVLTMEEDLSGAAESEKRKRMACRYLSV